LIHPYRLQKEKLLPFLQEILDGTNALSSKLVLIGAYDDESYIFWEK
jgi:hypothetical protein